MGEPNGDVRPTEGVSAFEGRLLEDQREGGGTPAGCPSLFFPGCSLWASAPGLAEGSFTWLLEEGEAHAATALCCARILDFKQGSGALKHALQHRLAALLCDRGVGRVVCACPNCASELRRLFAACEEELAAARAIEVVALPQLLARAGIRISNGQVAQDFEEGGLSCRIAVHDSCPDRETGEFADGVRSLFPPECLVELAHNRSGSHCCGALSNACGHTGLAARQAIDRAEEGQAAGASALATACMSCAQLLGALQGMLPVHHYLEFLYDCPIDWAARPYGTVPRLFLDAEGNAVELGALLP